MFQCHYNSRSTKMLMRHRYFFYGHAKKLGVEFKWQGKNFMTHHENSSFHLAHLTATQTSGSQHSFYCLNRISARTFTAIRLGFRDPHFTHCYLTSTNTFENPPNTCTSATPAPITALNHGIRYTISTP
jgi:hypothetical protein